MTKSNHPVDPFRARQYITTARRLAQEREAASRVVPKLLRTTSPDDWASLAGHPDLQTAGALERLGNVVSTSHAVDPNYALAVANIAVSIADSLPNNAYPYIIVAQLRCHAWKDLGKSLRFLARYDEALQALTVAEQALSEFGTLAHDRAIVQINVAVVLQETGRYDESLANIVQCKKVFREFGDTENVTRCGLLEGTVLQRQLRHREAREAYLLVLASTPDSSKESRAALHLAIGFSCVDLGDFDDAEDNLTRAIALFEEVGQPLNAAKGELARGRLLLRRAEYAGAVSHLRLVRREFLRHGLAEEAGLCGLEIVQALLILNRHGEANQLARKILHEFTTAKLNKRAVTALAYLTEAITAQRASVPLAKRIHEYVLSLRTNPERELDIHGITE